MSLQVDLADEWTFTVPDRVLSFPAVVTCMTVTPGCVWLVMSDGAVQVRSVSTTDLVHSFVCGLNPRRTLRVWSILTVPMPNAGLCVWMGLSNGTVEVYDAQTFTVVNQKTKHAGGVYCLAEFGGYVYSGGSDFKIAQWYAEDMRLVRMLHGHSNYVRCLYAEGNAVVSGSDDCTVRVWDVGSGEVQLTGYFHERSGVSAMCRAGITMWSGDDGGNVIVWRLDTCEALHVMQAHKGRVTSMKKVGSRVYSGGADGVIAVFDAEEGQLLGHVNNQNGVSVSSLVVTSELRRFCMWSSSGDKLVQCWHQDEYTAMIGDQERFSETFWYDTGSSPYREFRESVKKHICHLRETLRMRTVGSYKIADIFDVKSSASNVEELNKRETSLNTRLSSVEGRKVVLENQLKHSKEVLSNLEKETRILIGVLRTSQSELLTLDPAACSYATSLAGEDLKSIMKDFDITLPTSIAPADTQNTQPFSTSSTFTFAAPASGATPPTAASNFGTKSAPLWSATADRPVLAEMVGTSTHPARVAASPIDASALISANVPILTPSTQQHVADATVTPVGAVPVSSQMTLAPSQSAGTTASGGQVSAVPGNFVTVPASMPVPAPTGAFTATQYGGVAVPTQPSVAVPPPSGGTVVGVTAGTPTAGQYLVSTSQTPGVAAAWGHVEAPAGVPTAGQYLVSKSQTPWVPPLGVM
uniref:Uncharacterized protein TCIL3000_10_10020 n=1 Tax=Trypanosoma congolense (strain IL3000) TaxID=1068625 RepID=G0UXV7_TRYCI|nr:unnamed protein product [Trypanosoma congolense IL3000]